MWRTGKWKLWFCLSFSFFNFCRILLPHRTSHLHFQPFLLSFWPIIVFFLLFEVIMSPKYHLLHHVASLSCFLPLFLFLFFFLSLTSLSLYLLSYIFMMFWRSRIPFLYSCVWLSFSNCVILCEKMYEMSCCAAYHHICASRSSSCNDQNISDQRGRKMTTERKEKKK